MVCPKGIRKPPLHIANTKVRSKTTGKGGDVSGNDSTQGEGLDENIVRRAAVITMHGMGRAKPTYAGGLEDALRERLTQKGDEFHFGSVYYEDLLQPNQARVWEAVRGRLRWRRIREFGLFFLADAGALEGRKSEPESPYVRVQIRIAKEFHRAYREVGADGHVVFVAHSLGCQILSNYLWDAQRYQKYGRANVGIWTRPQSYWEEIRGAGCISSDELDFVGGRTLRYLYTTGCNIPMFVAGHPQTAIEAIRPIHSDFEWHNFYDKDDPLGWPLGDLSESYRELVCDHEVNAAGGFSDWILRSWNPLSHGCYWRDKKVLDHLHQRLSGLPALAGEEGL